MDFEYLRRKGEVGLAKDFFEQAWNKLDSGGELFDMDGEELRENLMTLLSLLKAQPQVLSYVLGLLKVPEDQFIALKVEKVAAMANRLESGETTALVVLSALCSQFADAYYDQQ